MIYATFHKGRALLTGERISPALVFNCGQAFRFDPFADGYLGVACGRVLFTRETNAGLELSPVTPGEYATVWAHYFDAALDYPVLEAEFARDPLLASALPCCRGMRLLNQPLFETLISFIISANNNVSRIKGIINKLCLLAGRPLSFCGLTLYDFPSPAALASLSEEQLTACGCGYRAKYIQKTARMVADGFPLESLVQMDYAAAREVLMKFPGVGSKVADCVLLFACGKKDAFPEDVWIHRVLCTQYGFCAKNHAQLREFVLRRFGAYGGIAQQYLFHCARTHKSVVK